MDGRLILNLVFAFFFPAQVILMHLWIRNQPEIWTEFIHRIWALPPCVSSFCFRNESPLCFSQCLWLVWILSAGSSGQKNHRFSVCAVMTVACSHDQSHKNWVTSPLLYLLESTCFYSLFMPFRVCVYVFGCFLKSYYLWESQFSKILVYYSGRETLKTKS